MDHLSSTRRNALPAFLLEALSGLIVVLAIIVLSEQLEPTRLVFRHSTDSLHTPVFLVSTYILMRAIKLALPAKRDSAGLVIGLASLLAFLCGLGIELIQPFFGREASFLDVWYDLLGICAAALIYAARVTKTSRYKRIVLISLALLLASIALIRPAYYLWVEKQQEQVFPVLFDFETNWQRELLSAPTGARYSFVERSEKWAEASGSVLKLEMESGDYPGIRFSHFNANWSAYSSLQLTLFSKSASAFDLALRIHDSRHNQQYEDRYHKNITVPPGATTITIALDDILRAPKGREMNMQEIQGIVVFTRKPKALTTLYMDNIRLSR